ncbi:MAG: anti-sigma factor antagonist [Spartobacteria bacterium]|nr:anti-sigma factor antagonist [Spartobacteria bacterium]
MKECAIDKEVKGDIVILTLNGSLDAYSFPNLERELKQLRENNDTKVVLDCTHLDYVHSAALGAFIGFARTSRSHGGDLKLVNLSPKIYNIVELLGFHKILDIHKDLAKAVSGF